MTHGTNVNNLYVFLSHHKKIATISIPVGSDTEISLTYESSWVEEGFAVSPYLPLDGNFDHRAVRNYLQNLLPEGKGLEDMTSNTTISKNNTFGLIKIIGEETSGALSFRGEGSDAKETTLREVTTDELGERLTRFKAVGESITYWDGRTRLSVAGVQDKLNLLEVDGTLGFGEGELCSNKIVKFETGKAPFIAVNELFTMLLADEFEISLPRMQLLMSQMIKSVLSSIDIAKDKALEQGLSAVEVNHIELCIEIIKEAAEEINKEIEDLPSMKEFFE